VLLPGFSHRPKEISAGVRLLVRWIEPENLTSTTADAAEAEKKLNSWLRMGASIAQGRSTDNPLFYLRSCRNTIFAASNSG
jgi:hypothetical protein